MSKIAPPDRRSTGFQTHLERRFTPGRFGGSAIRQVWKSRLLEPAYEGRDLAALRRPEPFPGQRSAQFLAASRADKITA